MPRLGRSKSFDLQSLPRQRVQPSRDSEVNGLELPNDAPIASAPSSPAAPRLNRRATPTPPNTGGSRAGQPLYENFWPSIAAAIRKLYAGSRLGLSKKKLELAPIACCICRLNDLVIPFLHHRCPVNSPREQDGEGAEEVSTQEDAMLLRCGHVVGHDCLDLFENLEPVRLRCPLCRYPTHMICPTHRALNLVDLSGEHGDLDRFFAEVKAFLARGPGRGGRECGVCYTRGDPWTAAALEYRLTTEGELAEREAATDVQLERLIPGFVQAQVEGRPLFTLL